MQQVKEHLPIEFKMKRWSDIEHWLEHSCTYQPKAFHTRMQALKGKCFSVGNTSHLKTFLEYNTIFDQHRNHWLKDINPELYNIL